MEFWPVTGLLHGTFCGAQGAFKGFFMRYRAVAAGLVHDRRATVHYLLVTVVMGVYGLWVCPMEKNLPVLAWLLHMGGVLLFARGARLLASRTLVARVSPDWQVMGLFLMDFMLLGASGWAMSLFNEFWYGTGIRSGVELTAGFLILGFFVGTDLALIHNRRLALKIGQGLFAGTDHYLSVPRKLVLVVGGSLFSVMATLFVVFVTDFDWLIAQGPSAMMRAKGPVMINLGFILSTLMAHTVNVVITYARNIRLFLEAETQALGEAAAGNLDSRMPVAFNNEMGVIAAHTNKMIFRLKEKNLMVEQLRDVIINSMASLAETRDNETGAHIRRTQHYVRSLAETLAAFPPYRTELNAKTIDLLYKTAPLHDIGKVGVPDAILLKPGRLTDDEFTVMKRHTLSGEEAIRRAESRMAPGEEASFLVFAREIAGAHHEKWDGSGYPRGLSGTAIPLSARLMALADVYDALRSRRVYKGAFTHAEARQIILDGRGTHFDPGVVDAFCVCEARFIEISGLFEDRGDGAGTDDAWLPKVA